MQNYFDKIVDTVNIHEVPTKPMKHRLLPLYAVLMGACVNSTPVLADIYTFVPTNGTAGWDNPLNWNPSTGIPNAIGEVVNLTSAATASLTINLNGNKTIGTLNLGSAGFITTVASGTVGSTLIFNPGDGNTANLNLSDVGSNAPYQAITAPIQIGGTNTTLSVNRTSNTQTSLNLASAIDVNGNTLVFNLTDTDTSSRVQLNDINSNITGSGRLIKTGAGVLGTTRNMTFAGDVSVSGGTFLLSGGNARLSGVNSVTVSNTALLRVGDSSSLTTITAANSRINPSAAGGIHLNSGRVYYNSGLTSGSTNTEEAPMLNFDSGSTTIDFALGSATTAYSLTYDGITRARGATWVLRSATTLGTSGTTIKLADASGLNLVGGGGAANTNTASIVPGMVGRNGAGTDPFSSGLSAAELVTYDSTNGFQVAGTYQTDINAATGPQNVSVGGSATLSSSKTINALRMVASNGNTLNLGGNTLSVTSGLLLLAPTTGVVNTVSNGTVDFGGAEGIINTPNLGTVVVSANLQGSNGFTKAGASTLTLTGSAAGVSGPVHVAAGVLQMGAADRLAGNSAVTLHNTTAVQLSAPKANVVTVLDLNNFDQTIGSLAGGGASGGNVALGAATLTTGGDNTSTQYDGVISGSGNVVKTGSGVWKVSGNNTYTGSTTVNAGTMVVNGASASSSVTIGENGMLKGSGNFAGNVSVAGILSPGDTVGTMTLTGDLSFANGSAINFELGTLKDLIVFTGIGQDLISAGPIALNYILGAGFVAGQSYTLFDWSGSTGFNASGFDVNDLSGTAGGYTAEYSVIGSTVAVTFTAVPEPSVTILMGLGVAMVAVVTRRRMMV